MDSLDYFFTSFVHRLQIVALFFWFDEEAIDE